MLIGIREALVLNCSRPALLGRVLATQPPCTRPLSPPCRGGVPTGPRPPAPLRRGGRLRGAGSAPILQCHGAWRISGEDEEKRRGRKAPSLSSSGHSLERGQNGSQRGFAETCPKALCTHPADVLPVRFPRGKGLAATVGPPRGFLSPQPLCRDAPAPERSQDPWVAPAPGIKVGASCEQVMGPVTKGKLPGSLSVARCKTCSELMEQLHSLLLWGSSTFSFPCPAAGAVLVPARSMGWQLTSILINGFKSG